MATTALYRTRDGRTDYGFLFVEHRPGAWRVYITRQPGYGGRPDDAHSTHRLRDRRGRYVCWTDPLPTLDAAKTVAAAWAEGTEQYRHTGVFGTRVDRLR